MLPVTRLLQVARGGVEPSGPLRRDRHRFGPARAAPEVVVWNVCRQCNLRCPHCYSAASRRRSPRELSTEEGVALIDELAASGVRMLIFSGGEPLLRPELEILVARAREKGLGAHLSTNGTLLHRNRARTLARLGLRYVGVSVDGPEEWNDAYRGLRGAFRAAVDAVGRAREAGMRTGVRMTLTRHNAASWVHVAGLAEELGADRFYLSHLLYSGRGLGLREADLDRASARALLAEVFAWADSAARRGSALEVVTGGNDSDGVLLLGWVRARYGPEGAKRVLGLLAARGGNSAGEKLLCIDEAGRVFPDQFWRSCVVGEVRRTPWARILQNPLLRELRQRESHLRGRCGRCAWLPVCRGSHRERALASGGDLWDPDPACVLEDDEVAGRWPFDPANRTGARARGEATP